jgi:ribosome-associated heat shock protein Hsp15
VTDAPPPAERLDRWLWHARFFRTRARAAEFAAKGRLRINRRRVDKASALVRVGDVLTFARGETVFVVEVLALAERRGGATAAQALYRDVIARQP